MKQTPEAIEQLKEFLEQRKFQFQSDYNDLHRKKRKFTQEEIAASNHAKGRALAYQDVIDALASLSTVEVRDVFVPVSVEDEPDKNGDYILIEDDTTAHRVWYFKETNTKWWWDNGCYDDVEKDIVKDAIWLKPAKAIIIEQ
jgi:hypothetical protein